MKFCWLCLSNVRCRLGTFSFRKKKKKENNFLHHFLNYRMKLICSLCELFRIISNVVTIHSFILPTSLLQLSLCSRVISLHNYAKRMSAHVIIISVLKKKKKGQKGSVLRRDESRVQRVKNRANWPSFANSMQIVIRRLIIVMQTDVPAACINSGSASSSNYQTLKFRRTRCCKFHARDIKHEGLPTHRGRDSG